MALNIQARKENCCIENFSPPSGPLRAREEMQSITQILRAGNTPPNQWDDPRNGVQGGVNMGTKCPSERTLGGSLVTFWTARKSLAPQGETL